MKKSVFLGMLVFLCFCVMAQNGNQALTHSKQNQISDYNSFRRYSRDDKAMGEFLRINNYELYNQFHEGVKLRRTGTILTFSGAGSACVGFVGLILLNVNDLQVDDGLVEFGAFMFYGGTALSIVGITIWSKGGRMRRHAVNKYKQTYFQNRTELHPSLDLNFT